MLPAQPIHLTVIASLGALLAATPALAQPANPPPSEPPAVITAPPDIVQQPVSVTVPNGGSRTMAASAAVTV